MVNGGKSAGQARRPSDHQRGRPFHVFYGDCEGYIGQVEKELLQADMDDVAGQVLGGTGVSTSDPGQVGVMSDG